MTPNTKSAPKLKGCLNEPVYNLDKGINDLHWDLQALAWGCEQLWLDNADKANPPSELARFPVAIVRMLAQRTQPLLDNVEKLELFKE
ncbi:hypothetical protein [Pararhizobium gei]|uniref:hypothetical protein n=1 Tax=Pararhizobium gei TaxID=1395951 RepID=UPI0023D9A876|nr:hypothetical protein [Rhizobium gei]